MYLSLLIIIGMLLSTSGFGIPDGKTILARVDLQQNQRTDITARVTFIQVRPVQGTRKYEMLYYRRDRDDAFLLVMLSPEVEAGNGYLKVGDNFWMYRRNTRTFQHINRDENISGTDIKGGDLESRKMSQLYKVRRDASGGEMISETNLGKIHVYRMETEAIVDDVTYPRQTLWVRRDNSLILKIENYSQSGTLVLTQLFPKYTQIQGRYLPKQGYNIDEFEKGNRTVWDISDFSFQLIAPGVFTKAYLENLSR